VRDQLATHLSQLKRDGVIEEWSDQHILPGSDRAKKSSRRSTLLISSSCSSVPSFLASDALLSKRDEASARSHRAGCGPCCPVLVRRCDWQHSPFAHLQCLPQNKKPVSRWRNRMKAFLEIATGIRRVVEDLTSPWWSSPLSLQANRARSHLSTYEDRHRQRLLNQEPLPGSQGY